MVSLTTIQFSVKIALCYIHKMQLDITNKSPCLLWLYSQALIYPKVPGLDYRACTDF